MMNTPPTNTLLILDTTTDQLMIGIYCSGERVFKHNEHSTSARYHSSVLIPLLKDAMAFCKLSVEDIEGIGVNAGPGSFTGLRTGMTTARIMAQFQSVPLYVFNTFELLAVKHFDHTVAVYLDALRGNAYHACLKMDITGQPHYITPPSCILMDTQAMPDSTDTIVIDDIQNVFTPDAMQMLIQQNPSYYQRPWHEALPLYLQSPNITQRKPKTHTLR